MLARILLIGLLALTFGFREPICIVGCCAEGTAAAQDDGSTPCHGDPASESQSAPTRDQGMECSGDAEALPTLAHGGSVSFVAIHPRPSWNAESRDSSASTISQRFGHPPAPLDLLLAKSSLLL